MNAPSSETKPASTGTPSGNPLAARMAAISEEEPLGLAEARRVCGIRASRRLTQEEVDAISEQEIEPSWFNGTNPECAIGKDGKPVPFRLRWQQAQGIYEFDETGGAFLPLRVSAGKTIIGFLCIKHAHAPGPFGRAIERSILIVPARAYRKLVSLDVPKMQKILGFQVPVHKVAGLPPKKRIAICKARLRGVYLYTWSLLSQEQAQQELELIAPQLIVGDEAHAVVDEGTHAASKKRLRRAIERCRPMCVWMSGTMAKHSFLDCWHLICFALREKAPVPLESAVAAFWANVIDAAPGARLSEDLLRSLEPVREWVLERVRAGEINPEECGGPLTPDIEGMRRAYRVRRNTSPGVVASAENSLGTSLWIVNRPAFNQVDALNEDSRLLAKDSPAADPSGLQIRFDALVSSIQADLEQEFPVPLPKEWQPTEAFAQYNPFRKMIAYLWAVVHRYRTPNGDEIEDARHTWRWQYEISAGFFNELLWPTLQDIQAKTGCSEDEAKDLLKRAKHHRTCTRSYVKEQREWLTREHVPGLDTPLLVAGACARGDRRVPEYLRAEYEIMKDAAFEGMPERFERKNRVCDWKIKAAVAWAREIEREHGKSTGGLIWCVNREIMKWAHEVFLAEFGQGRVLYCPAGAHADRVIQEVSSAKYFTIASVKGHYEAKDLPHYGHQIYIQAPRNANVCEQGIGRTHRDGQKLDDLIVNLMLSTEFDRASYSATLHDAMWLSQAESPQKIIHANYDPLPRRYPSKFLTERGFKLEGIGQDAALNIVFGPGE